MRRRLQAFLVSVPTSNKNNWCGLVLRMEIFRSEEFIILKKKEIRRKKEKAQISKLLAIYGREFGIFTAYGWSRCFYGALVTIFFQLKKVYLKREQSRTYFVPFMVKQ
jgi:hypothetical protein